MLLGSTEFAMQILSDALRRHREVVRHELTEEQWARVERHLPARKCEAGRGGRPARSARQVLNGMLWILRAGAPWRDLPPRYGPWQTVYGRFNEWRRMGVFDALVETLQGELVLGGQIDRDLWCVDGTNVRAARCAAGAQRAGPAAEPEDHALGYSRGGFGTKLHLLTDGHGVPLAAALTPGQTHESKGFRPVLSAVCVPDGRGRYWRRPRALAGDKAYSCAWIRSYLRIRRVERVIPQKSDQVGRRGGHRKFDTAKYYRRHVIEQCVGWLKELRRLCTRFEKLAVNFLAMAKLGFVDRYLRLFP